MVTIVGYPKCTTCKRAEAFLKEMGVDYTYRHIKDKRPSRDELVSWHAQSALPLKRFFNTSGMKYRELNLKDKIPSMSEAEQFDLLATDGMLVKRPILITERGVTTGFKEDAWKLLL